MKKVFIVFVVGLLVAAGVSYFGAQWKVDKEVKNIINSMQPFVDASYDNVKIGLDGRISINKLNFYESSTETTIRIDSIGLSTSNLLETLQLENSFKEGALPKALAIDIQGLALDIPRSLFSQLDAVFPRSNVNQLFALGCGELDSFGPMQFYDLGFNNLVMDMSVGYTYEMALDEFVTTSTVSIDGMGAVESEQTILGLLDFMENYRTVLSYNFENVSTQNMRLNIRDFGANNKLVDYCAKKAKLTTDQWRELHADMVATALNQLELSSAFDIKEAYEEFLQPGVEIDISLRPLPGFDWSQLGYYTPADLINLTNLQFTLNDNQLDFTDLSYNPDNFEQLNFKAVRLLHQMTIESDKVIEPVDKISSTEQKLISVPKSDLKRYVGRNVYLERSDGQVFIGAITAVSSEQVQLRIRIGAGYSDLRVDMTKIKSSRIYP